MLITHHYSINRGFLLVENSDLMFCFFHSLITYAVSIVIAAVDKEDNNPYFSRWKECTFSGSEPFAEVASALRDKLVNVGHYLKFIRKLPFMWHLVSVKSNVDGTKILVSLNMSLRCFEKLLVDECGEAQTANINDIVTAENLMWNEKVGLLENEETHPKDKIHMSSEDNISLGRDKDGTNALHNPFPNDTELVSKGEVIEWKAAFYHRYQPKFATLTNTTLLSASR